MKFKIRSKINFIVIICLVSLCVILGTMNILISHSLVHSKLETSLTSNMNYLVDLLETTYPGDFEASGQELLKGGFNLKDAVTLHRLKARTNMEYTLFSGDTRISTTIDDASLIGTSANDDVINSVLKSGKTFKDQTIINGKDYMSYYAPIKDASGNIIGMYFVGEAMTPYTTLLFQILFIVLAITIISIIVTSIIISKFSLSLSQPINDVLSTLTAIKNRDFTKTINSKILKRTDEIGDLANGLLSMQNTMGSLLNNFNTLGSNILSDSKTLDKNAYTMSESSETIVNITQEIAANTTTQANSLIHINDIVNTFSSSIDTMSASLSTVSTASEEIGALSKSSTTQMQEVTASIESFHLKFKDFTNKITDFENRVVAVQEMANVIDSISNQTNLLALNAAIEAARAGEAGKGFSVVAEEIRSLAAQSQASTQNISDIVLDLSSASKQLALDTANINTELTTQLNNIHESISVFSSIVDSINTVIPQIAIVHNETEAVSAQKNVIVEKVDHASSIAQNISAACEEVAASCEENNTSIEELSHMATTLDHISSTLKTELDTFHLQ